MSLLVKEKIEDVTPSMLFKIPASEPEKLFSSGDAAQIRREFRGLAKRWHSGGNLSPEANQVMQHLNELHANALKKLESGSWETPNTFTFETINRKKYKLRYKKKHSFELDEMYICATSVAFVMSKGERELYDNARDIIGNLNYPSEEMRQRLSASLPRIKDEFETEDKLILILEKDDDDILLADVLDHQGGKIEPVHAAWMISRLHNLGSYLSWADLTHNAISVETCFISPRDHRVSLLGGWWYAAKQGNKLKALPPKTVAVAPAKTFDRPIADSRLDLALIRATGREILGDRTGMRLIGDPDIPKPMSSWVNGASSGNAYQDFKFWSENVLTSSFGARRFVEMKLSPNDIYQP